MKTVLAAAVAPPTPARAVATTGDRGVLAAPRIGTSATAGDLAARAYARLGAGDRREAVRLFEAALAIGDPRGAAWTAQRATLVRRWSGSAYSIVRAAGAVDLAGTPLLGGGQSGGTLTYTPDPLARRPFALITRVSTAHDDGGRSALAAVGVIWHSFAGVTIAAERLVPVGPAARGDWTVRVAGGAARNWRGIDGSVYGEAGIVGRSTYAAAQARVGERLLGGRLIPGIGTWAGIQRNTGQNVDRLDVGPGLTARIHGVTFAIDYRFRVAGNAAPGSGPVLGVSSAF